MRSFSAAFAIFILGLSVLGLFQIKFHVQDLSRDINEFNRQLKQENESLHILKAEWTYLNQPERLKHLVNKYLKLENLHLSQMYKMEDSLPLYLAEDEVKRELYISSIEINKYNNKNNSMINKNTQLTSGSKILDKNKPQITRTKY
jgi:hypothetical protein